MIGGRRGLRWVTASCLVLLTACSSVQPPSSRPASVPTHSPTARASAAPAPAPTPVPLVCPLPGEAASLPALPAGVPFTGHLLIAESSAKSRILEMNLKGNVTWTLSTYSPPLKRTLGPPDDAFYTPGCGDIVANSEWGQGVLAVDRLTQAVLWQIGSYRRRGRGPTLFNNPDDLAVPATDGTVWLADINNCRLIHLNGATGAVLGILGGRGCRHNPPQQFTLPNGVFPTSDGSLVVTEISGSHVTWLNPNLTVRWSRRVAARYPSDAMAYPDGSVLLTDYSSLGAVLLLNPDGSLKWRYAPRGAGQLDHPSIAIPLASNRVAICDDFGNRILILDPTTMRVVWEWSGNAAYHLVRPDGLDYRPT